MSDINGNNNIPSDPTVPTIDKPEFEVPPQPAQFQQPQFEQTNYQQQNFQQQGFQQMNYQQPVYTQNVMPPKKSNKKLVGIISAIAGVAIIGGVAVFAGPKIIDALSGNSKKAPLDRLKNAVTDSSKKLSDSVRENKDQIIAKQEESFSTNLKLNVKLGDYIVGMIPQEYSGLKDTTIDMDLVGANKQYYFDMDLATSASTAATLKGFVNAEEQNVYLQIPQLSNSYLSTAFDVSDFEAPQATAPKIDPEEFATLIDDEAKTFLDSIKDVTLEEDVTVEANGIKAKYDKLSVAMNGSDFSQTVYNCYERLSQETFLKELFDLYAKESGITVSDTLEELKDWASNNDQGVTLDFYMDDKDKITGFVIIPDSHSAKEEIGYVTATDKETGFNFYAKEDNEYLFTMEGSYTESNDVYNGDVKLSVYDNGIADTTIEVKYKDVTWSEKEVKGTFTLSSSELSGFTIVINADCKEKSGTLGVSVGMAAMDMATVTLDYSVGKADSCPTLPSDAVVYDAETQIEDYMSTADLMGFITTIEDATGIDITGLIQDSLY